MSWMAELHRVLSWNDWLLIDIESPVSISSRP